MQFHWSNKSIVQHKSHKHFPLESRHDIAKVTQIHSVPHKSRNCVQVKKTCASFGVTDQSNKTRQQKTRCRTYHATVWNPNTLCHRRQTCAAVGDTNPSWRGNKTHGAAHIMLLTTRRHKKQRQVGEDPLLVHGKHRQSKETQLRTVPLVWCRPTWEPQSLTWEPHVS